MKRRRTRATRTAGPIVLAACAARSPDATSPALRTTAHDPRLRPFDDRPRIALTRSMRSPLTRCFTAA